MIQADKPMAIPWTARDVMAATLTILAVVAAFFLLFWFRDIVFALFLAIVLSIAISPAVDILYRRVGVPRWLGVCVVYVALLVLVVLAGALMLPLLVDQVTAVIAKAPAAYETVRSALEASGNAIIVSLATGMPAQLFSPGASSSVGSVGRLSLSPLPWRVVWSGWSLCWRLHSTGRLTGRSFSSRSFYGCPRFGVLRCKILSIRLKAR